MRISTANAYNSAIDSLMLRQNDLMNLQTQLTTLKRVNKASDDPAAAARAERAGAAEARATASQRAVDASKNAMTLTESALGNANDLLQQVRDALVAAGNASYSDVDRKSLAETISGLRAQLLAVANSSDGSGSYLFGGQGAAHAPFVEAAGGVRYTGSSGQSQAASGDALPLSIDGQVAWMQARGGNGVFQTSAGSTNAGSAWIDAGSVTDARQQGLSAGSVYQIEFSVAGGATTYSVLKDGAAMPSQTNVAFTPGQAIQVDGMSATISGQPAEGDTFGFSPAAPSQSVFDTLDRAIADLSTAGRSGAQIAQSNSSNLANVDAALGQLQAARSAAGSVLNRIDNITGRLSAQGLAAQTEASNATDLDMTKALSAFANQQTGYDAALKSYAMVQKLSLFQYLSG